MKLQPGKEKSALDSEAAATSQIAKLGNVATCKYTMPYENKGALEFDRYGNGQRQVLKSEGGDEQKFDSPATHSCTGMKGISILAGIYSRL
jgi:hypothetical protein